MSKTSEAKKFIKEIDDKVGEYWSDSDVELAHYITMFSDQQSSSKDARIKELEVQISGKTFFDEKETMAAKIQELEARLETAESGLEKAINFIDNEADKAMRNGSCRDVVDYYDNFKSELKAFLTNKTE